MDMVDKIKSVKDIVEELFQYYDDIDCAVTVDQRITAKEQAELWLKRTINSITQYHQEELEKVVDEIFNNLKEWINTRDHYDGTGSYIIKDNLLEKIESLTPTKADKTTEV